MLDPKKPNAPTTISQNFDGRILLNDSWFPVNRKNPNPNLFKFCSELRNRKSDPVINIFHGGGQNREFCKTVSRKQNGGVFKFPFSPFSGFWEIYKKKLNSCYIYFHGGVVSPGASVCLFRAGTDPFVCEQSAPSASVRARVSW